jgi:hypothetical protein
MWVNGTQFIQQPASANALTNPGAAHADAYKAIVSQWLVTRNDPQELSNLAYMLGNGGILSKFKESLPLLRRIIQTEGVQGYAKGQALSPLVQQRGKEEVPFLKTLMSDDAMAQQVWFPKPNGQAEMHNCLMKDVALALMISLDNGNLKEYGFETPQGVPINPHQIGQYAFTSDEKRAAGFMHYGWKQLKAGIDGPPSKGSPKDAPKETPKDGPVEAKPATPAPSPVKQP